MRGGCLTRLKQKKQLWNRSANTVLLLTIEIIAVFEYLLFVKQEGHAAMVIPAIGTFYIRRGIASV